MNDETNKHEIVVLSPTETSYGDLFWDEEGTSIGDAEMIFLDKENISLSSLKGLKEWFLQADKYDPYTEYPLSQLMAWMNGLTKDTDMLFK